MKAGTLAFVFAVFTLLPWAHVLLCKGHDGHVGCRPPAVAEVSAGQVPVVLAEPCEAPHICWICQNLFSLLQHTESVSSFAAAFCPPATRFYARAPEVRAALPVYPASRSQAPPVRI